jgi:hypothetical protein
MHYRLIASFAAILAVPTFAAEPEQNAEWKLVRQTNGVAIQTRPHPGSKFKEFKAVGEIDASTRIVHDVIDDVEAYTSFMPYTVEARIIQRKDKSIVAYQRLSPKIVADRDYTLEVEKKSWPTENGLAFFSSWKPANEQGPAEKPGVFRVKLCDGSWFLEPRATNKTLATYSVFTDSGITLPSFLTNAINETGIAQLFAAVRKQAKDPKYQTK